MRLGPFGKGDFSAVWFGCELEGDNLYFFGKGDVEIDNSAFLVIFNFCRDQKLVPRKNLGLRFRY